MGLENPLHILILLVILLLVFGAKRLPEMGRGLGQGMRDFKDALTNGDSKPSEPATPPVTAQAAPLPEAPAAAVAPAETPAPANAPAESSDPDRNLTSAA
jgi:sec-independent protein translocase protein TatA